MSYWGFCFMWYHVMLGGCYPEAGWVRMAKVGIHIVGRLWALDLVPSWQTTKALTHGLSLDLDF